MQPLAFVDIETTGLTAPRDRITEIGIVEVDDNGVREWSSLINPETQIPNSIQAYTGITDDMVRDAPTFEEIAKETLERLDGRLFIAHNARFDYSFLKASFRRAGYEFRPTVLCTVRLSRKLYPEHQRHNLDSLIERHGLSANGRHRALADAQLIHQFWEQVQRAQSPADFESILKELTARQSLPPNLDSSIVDTLPDGPGVYLFYGENELPLYIGKAKDLRKRVLSHFAADHSSPKELRLAQQVRRIEWIDTGGEVGAFLKESELIKKMQPTHNRQLRRSNELCTITLVESENGHLTPTILYARDLNPSENKNLYGLFKSAKAATAALRELAVQYGLCHVVLDLENARAGNACFARQLKKSRGACVGAEPMVAHSVRLLEGLSRLRLKAWPFSGPAYLKEGDEVLLVDNWRFLGTAKSNEELWTLFENQKAQFDRDTYRILSKVANKMKPLASPAGYDSTPTFLVTAD